MHTRTYFGNYLIHICSVLPPAMQRVYIAPARRSCIESWWRSRKTFHFNHGQSRDLVLVKCRTKFFLCLFGEQQQSTTLFSHSKNGPSNSNEKPSWMGGIIQSIMYAVWFLVCKRYRTSFGTSTLSIYLGINDKCSMTVISHKWVIKNLRMYS